MPARSVLSQPAWRLRVADLNPHRPRAVDLQPGADERAALAQEFGLLALPALRLRGELRAVGVTDWELQAELCAEVVQPCVVSLRPVRSRIDEPVRRRWTPEPPEPEAEEAEMGDDELDVLGRVIDLGAVLAEALALALPAWPRAADAELPDLAGAQAATEEVRRPFAGLSDLLADKVGGGAGDEEK